jgi:exopolysaccharide biosynthesis polyprenyl glycosylphosphotransferase
VRVDDRSPSGRTSGRTEERARRAPWSAPADPPEHVGERFKLVPPPARAPVERAAERLRFRHRLLADPLWTSCATVLVVLDVAVLFFLTRSGWLVAMALLVSAALGSYRHRHTLSLSEGDGRYAILTAAVVAPMLAVGDLPLHVALYTVSVIAGLLLSRAAGFWVVKQIRSRWPRPVFIAGAGHIARVLDRALAEHPEYGLQPAAFVCDVPVPDADRPVYAYADAFPELQKVDAVGLICAFGPEPQAEQNRLVRDAEVDRRHIWVVPRLFDLSPRRDEIWGLPIAVIQRPAIYKPVVRFTKRLIDISVAALALVLLSPLILALALIVRLTSRGPVFFRQRRVGLRGVEFTMLKFRTMQVASDADTGWTVPDDPRRTPTGRLLRRTSLDELPQLLNVVLGHMSLVGPRPERRVFAEQFAEELPTYPERTRVAGGITGLAQVHDLRGDSSIEDRARYDNRYIDQYSLFLDVVIALRTVGSLFRSKQSY